jgi:hypothetical protein
MSEAVLVDLARYSALLSRVSALGIHQQKGELTHYGKKDRSPATTIADRIPDDELFHE